MTMKQNITAGALAEIIRLKGFNSVVMADGSGQGVDFTFDPPRQLDKNLFNVNIESETEWALHVAAHGVWEIEVGCSFSVCRFPRRLIFPVEPSDGCLKVKDAKVINNVLRLYLE